MIQVGGKSARLISSVGFRVILLATSLPLQVMRRLQLQIDFDSTVVRLLIKGHYGHVMSLRRRRFATVGCADGLVPTNALCPAAMRSRLAPDWSVHVTMLSIQHVIGLPRFLVLCTRPVIKLPSMLSCGNLMICPK